MWRALVEPGPAAGIEVTGWLTDRAGWQEWERVGRWSSHPSRLTPDAVATFLFDGAKAVAFVEVDLASMTQTVLKQKVARYLAYADDLAWQGGTRTARRCSCLRRRRTGQSASSGPRRR